MKEIEEIISELKSDILTCGFYGENFDEADWAKHIGVLITANEAQKIIDVITSLQYYKDSTLGLWATDKPEKLQDPDKVLFQLKDEGVNI